MELNANPADLVRVAPSSSLFDTLFEQEQRQPLDVNYKEYYQALSTSVVRAGAKIKTLSTAALVGTYRHSDPEIETFIRNNFKNMNGSWQESLFDLAMYAPLGNKVAPLELTERDMQWVIDRLVTLDLRYTTFLGQSGDVTGVRYSGQTTRVDIPIERCAHLVYDSAFTPDRTPYGLPEIQSVLPLWKAWKTMLGQLLIAGQNNSSPMLHGRTDDVTVSPDPDPQFSAESDENISAIDLLAQQLERLRASGNIATDRETDIDVVEAETKGELFQWALEMFERLMMLCFLVPETTVSVGRGGLGNVTMSENHSKIFMVNVEAIRDQLVEILIEKIVTPLIVFNYGEQKDYGDFIAPPTVAATVSETVDGLVKSANAGLMNSEMLMAATDRLSALFGLDEIDTGDSEISKPPSYQEVG